MPLSKPITCQKCGTVWNPATDDIVALFNHNTLHTWIGANFKGTMEWSIRQQVGDKYLILSLWVRDEMLRMGYSMEEALNASVPIGVHSPTLQASIT